MRILLIQDDPYGDPPDVTIFDNVDEFQRVISDDDIEFYSGSGNNAFYLPPVEQMRRVDVMEQPRYIVTNNPSLNTVLTPETLPAPLKGETVGEYARRITGVPATMNLAEDH